MQKVASIKTESFIILLLRHHHQLRPNSTAITCVFQSFQQTRQHQSRFFYLSSLGAADDPPCLLEVLGLNNEGALRRARTLRPESDDEFGVLLRREGSLGGLNREGWVAIGGELRTEIGKTHVLVAHLELGSVLLPEVGLELNGALNILAGGNGTERLFKVKFLSGD